MPEFHPAANIFPLMQGEAFESLVADIRAHGQHEPIWLFNGKIIDGRNRYRACLEAGVEPKFRQYDGTEEWLVQFILSANLERRHLTSDQRAACAVEALSYERRLAKQRQRQGGEHKVPQKIGEAKKHFGEATQRVAKQFKTNRTYISFLAKLRDEVPADFEAVKAGEKRLGDIKTAHARRDIERQRLEIAEGRAALPEGKFEVIVIDPPWPYDTQYSPTHWTGRAGCRYPVMSITELQALELPTAKNCILWLWTTNAFMGEACDLLEAWGFQRKTILTWMKPRLGLGHWLRNRTKHCLLAVKGSPKVSLTNQSTVLEAPAREHSRKPDEFYKLVETLCLGRRLDYFSREKRPGWEQFGSEPEKFQNGAS